MRVNVVRIFEDSDYQRLRNLCDQHADWAVAYDKKTIKVWTRTVPESSFQMIKARAEFPDVPASVAYDVIHDPNYRSTWDKYMLNARDIGLLNPNNDICYYALGAIPPFRSRDFVMQRSWLDLGEEKIICSHSVCHDNYPPQKGYIRATVFITGYVIRRKEGGGCQVTYVTHSDPRGKLPTWLVNRITKIVAPKVIKKLHRACLAYPAWKELNKPHWKPWSFPDQQIDIPRVDPSQCQPRDYDEEILDESALSARDVKEEDDEN